MTENRVLIGLFTLTLVAVLACAPETVRDAPTPPVAPIIAAPTTVPPAPTPSVTPAPTTAPPSATVAPPPAPAPEALLRVPVQR